MAYYDRVAVLPDKLVQVPEISDRMRCQPRQLVDPASQLRDPIAIISRLAGVHREVKLHLLPVDVLIEVHYEIFQASRGHGPDDMQHSDRFCHTLFLLLPVLTCCVSVFYLFACFYL